MIMSVIHCPYCGKINRLSAHFCISCGKPLSNTVSYNELIDILSKIIELLEELKYLLEKQNEFLWDVILKFLNEDVILRFLNDTYNILNNTYNILNDTYNILEKIYYEISGRNY